MKEYKTIKEVVGPLVLVDNVENASYDELVEIVLQDGSIRRGKVIMVENSKAVVQLFESSIGIAPSKSKVRFLSHPLTLKVGQDMLGRVFNGLGHAIDGGEDIIAEKFLDINSSPINPYARDYPREFIETGISAIDGLNTLVRGQKLPIFSMSGLPSQELTMQIARQARLKNKNEKFAVVFSAIGITFEEADYYIKSLEASGAIEKSVMFINLASDPAIERLATPKVALTCAEYLAFTQNSIYERAGRIKNREGSITQIPVLTMPEDDKTHPIPDLTGYITEGQIVLSRQLYKRGVTPMIDVLSSLSRLKDKGMGEGKTREDHSDVANEIIRIYASGKESQELSQILGEGALTDRDKLYANFSVEFEKRFLSQGFYLSRSIEETLDIMWDLLSLLPKEEIKRIKKPFIEKYLNKKD